MASPEPPLRRSIGLSGIVRWVIVVMAVVAVGAALNAHAYGLAIGALVFFIAVAVLAYRLWRGGGGAV